jgi:hypothetical protein
MERFDYTGMTSRTVPEIPVPQAATTGNKLPWSPLLALSTAAFMGILTEALPAGVLPEMARDLSVSESAAGQMLTIYAIATGLSAIPLIAATSAWAASNCCCSPSRPSPWPTSSPRCPPATP